MDSLIKLLELFKSNQIPEFVKLILNFIFVASLASFFFEKYYYSYELIEFTDYKVLIEFFITGYFFIPLLIFLSLWFITGFVLEVFFFIVNIYLNVKIKDFIRQVFISTKETAEIIRDSQKIIDSKFPKYKISKWFRSIILKLKKEAALKSSKLNNVGSDIQSNSISNFKLYTRGLICCLIYFTILPHFGILLLIICILIYLISICMNVVGYQVGEFLTENLLNYISMIEVEYDLLENSNLNTEN